MDTPMFQRWRLAGPVTSVTSEPGLEQQGVVVGSTLAVFKAWGRTDCSLALWQREPPPDIPIALNRLQLDHVAGFRFRTDAEDAHADLRVAVAASGIEEPALQRFFAADMTLLARLFAASTGTARLELRLEVVRDDACRLFHVDRYPARLAVTYVGPGTVCVPRCHGDEALAKQIEYSGPTLELPAFSVGMFVGEQHGRVGLVHRSPRIAGTGRVRLFFCLNAAGH